MSKIQTHGSSDIQDPLARFYPDDIIHIVRPNLSPHAATAFGTAHPTNFELLPNTLWRIRSVKRRYNANPSTSSSAYPSSGPILGATASSYEYTATPLTVPELCVPEEQVVLAQMDVGMEVVKVVEERVGLPFVYRVEEVRVVCERSTAAAAERIRGQRRGGDGLECVLLQRGGFVVMVRMLDEVGQMRDCKAEELRIVTEEERKEGKEFCPVVLELGGSGGGGGGGAAAEGDTAGVGLG